MPLFSRHDDRYAWRGDADTFDTDMLGPGHVPEPDETRASQEWESYNWGGDRTNKWGREPSRDEEGWLVWDVDGTNIGGAHFLGTGTYEFGSEDELDQYLRTTPNAFPRDAYAVGGADGDGGRNPGRHKDEEEWVVLSPFHGTIEKGEDGELKFSPGLFETEEMQRRGHEEFWASSSGGGEGDDSRDPGRHKDEEWLMPAVEEEDEKEQSDSPLDRFGDRLDGKDSDMFGRKVDASRKKDGDDSEE